MLDVISRSLESHPQADNLLLAERFRTTIRNEQGLLKATIKFAMAADVPCMAFATSLNYLKAFASSRLPANLIQAQRDFFGAHTYQRIDKEGIFHTPDWADQ